MFPELLPNNNDNPTVPVEKSMGTVFLFDFSKQQFVIKDGKLVEATYEEAIRQWISIVLITEKGKYGVYKDLDFGLSIAQFIGRKDIPIGVLTSDIKRQIEEQLIKHPEIEGLQNFSLSRKDSKAIISFEVLTKRGVIQGGEYEVKFSG